METKQDFLFKDLAINLLSKAFVQNILDSKQNSYSNNLDSKQDFCSNVLEAKQNIYSKYLVKTRIFWKPFVFQPSFLSERFLERRAAVAALRSGSVINRKWKKQIQDLFGHDGPSPRFLLSIYCCIFNLEATCLV